MLQDAFPALLMLGWFFCILSVGGAVVKYIFPHIKPLNRFFDSLPLGE
jgi:hypothetical protein